MIATQIQDHQEEVILLRQTEKAEVVEVRKSDDVEEAVQVPLDQDQEAERGENPVEQVEEQLQKTVVPVIEILVQTEEEIGIETLNQIPVQNMTTEEKAAQGGPSALVRVLRRRSTRKNGDENLTIRIKQLTSYVCTKGVVLKFDEHISENS